ncbi:hypothetical protein NC651_007957 [Populus alba x Populus x berolinensis]|nr:hypothetical protein NC651_007957 [Populus alba x Populus x berolinensis]
MRPDLFKFAFAGVPFVDAFTTMLDPTIPLTTSLESLSRQEHRLSKMIDQKERREAHSAPLTLSLKEQKIT